MKWYLTVLTKYTTFNGRARRSEYWYFVLFNVIISIVLNIVDASFGMSVLSPIYSLIVLIPGIAVGVRRMHDVDKSGWFFLIPIYDLVLACTEGTTGANRFGPDPKRPEFEEFLQETPN